LMSLHS